jgi:hypothetical protein
MTRPPELPPFLRRQVAANAANRWRDDARTALAPGETILVAVSETLTASLWLLKPVKGGGDNVALIGKVAEAAWRRAYDLQSEIPYLWRADGPLGERQPLVCLLKDDPADGRQAEDSAQVLEVDGSSFGLSFALAQASEVLGLPLPEDLAASAALDSRTTDLVKVDGLQHKIKVLTRYAPRIRRLMVAPGNVPEAREIVASLGGALEIVEVADYREAAEVAFGPLGSLLDPASRSETWRRDVLDSLCELGWTTRGGVRAWPKVAAAALRILADGDAERWQLSDTERKSLAFASAVAQRHAANQGTLTLPAAEELEGIPEPRRSQYMAHVLQQIADTACADATAALVLATRLIPEQETDRHPAHLELLGAQARLWAVMGRTAEALELARATTGAWMRRRLHAEASRPLCLWLRLAAAARQMESLAEALDTANVIRQRQCLDSPQFLNLAEAYALAAIADRRDDALALLGSLLQRPNDLAPEVRLSAMRLSLQCMAANPTAAQTLREDLARDTSDLARTFICLADIDANRGDPEDWLPRLARDGGGLIQNLVYACPETEARARAMWIARWFPY